MRVEDLKRDPGALAGSFCLADGQAISVRPLEAGDADAFGCYLVGLSAETRSRFRPHEFDRFTAETLCAAIDYTRTLRIVATADDHPDRPIVAYFIVSLSVPSSDLARYRSLGIELDPGRDCALGPSVTDAWQNRGLGSAMLGHVFEVARRLGRQRMILWGGVIADNHRAVHFYRKHGFVKVGEFHTDVNNDDMIREL
jgi:GNAT superfamily N-acetyltransferase